MPPATPRTLTNSAVTPRPLVRLAFRLLTSPVWWLVRGALLDVVLAHIARAGFAPQPFERAGARIAGIAYRNRIIAPTDRLPSAEAHYLRHVVAVPEWPVGTTLADYLTSLETLVQARTSGVVVGRFRSRWHLATVGESGAWQGPQGHPLMMVEYRLSVSRWMTGFQLQRGLAHFQDPQRSDVRWLRHLQSRL